MLVKRELHKELLKDLRVTTSILLPTAHLFQPSGTAAGVANEETRRFRDVMAV